MNRRTRLLLGSENEIMEVASTGKELGSLSKMLQERLGERELCIDRSHSRRRRSKVL